LNFVVSKLAYFKQFLVLLPFGLIKVLRFLKEIMKGSYDLYQILTHIYWNKYKIN